MYFIFLTFLTLDTWYIISLNICLLQATVSTCKFSLKQKSNLYRSRDPNHKDKTIVGHDNSVTIRRHTNSVCHWLRKCPFHIPIAPQALGEDMLVPFMSCVPRNVQLGTAAIAPPGALILTPRSPSVLQWNTNQWPHISIMASKITGNSTVCWTVVQVNN